MGSHPKSIDELIAKIFNTVGGGISIQDRNVKILTNEFYRRLFGGRSGGEILL